MILIADSGSTKTDWRLIDESGKVHQELTSGINPYYQSSEEINEIISDQLKIDEDIDDIHFYGAGCSSQTNKIKVANGLNLKFKKARVYVEDDMLAAARALAGHKEGIVCILGTGSNACLYDGEKITKSIPSLGYVMGDEGSGNSLGKQLIKDYFGQKLSKENKVRFEGFGVSSIHEILDQVYKKQKPSAFLAGYSRLIQEHISDPYFYQLVYNSFRHFVEVNVKFFDKYAELPIHFTGSVAFIYGNILRQLAANENLYIDKIIQSPIAGLTLFHQSS